MFVPGKAASPVTEVALCTVGVTGAGQAAVGAVGEVALRTVLTLQTVVARQALTLAAAVVALVWI